MTIIVQRILRSILTVAFVYAALASVTTPAKAQVSDASGTNTAFTPSIGDALACLPASEAVMYFDVRRLLNEAVPRAFGNSSEQLDRINRDIETFSLTSPAWLTN